VAERLEVGPSLEDSILMHQYRDTRPCGATRRRSGDPDAFMADI
jgi:hypothetical protein